MTTSSPTITTPKPHSNLNKHSGPSRDPESSQHHGIEGDRPVPGRLSAGASVRDDQRIMVAGAVEGVAQGARLRRRNLLVVGHCCLPVYPGPFVPMT